MPLAVLAIGVSIFALTSTEFVISGLLPLIADDVGVTIPQAGMLISAFAVAMVVAPPVAAAATLRLPAKATLVALLAVFAAGQALGALAPDYWTLFASRVVTGLAAAAFWAVGAAAAVTLVPYERRGRALAVVTGGLALATTLGVPLGTVLGQHTGWRATFWLIGATALLALAGIAALMPASQRNTDRDRSPRLLAELRSFADRRVWIALSTTVLTQAAVFATYSYASPYLTEVAGTSESAVPTILLLYGAGGVVGLLAGGRAADWRPLTALTLGAAGLVAVFAVLWLAPASPVLAAAMILLMGLFGLFINPALNVRVYALVHSPTFAGASSTSAFNVGNTVGPWLGGTAISAGFGLAAPAWVSVVLAVAALAMVALAAYTRAPSADRVGTGHDQKTPERSEPSPA
ncbi:DHA1 family chloramphenicol resistance protein-like MFS transporter [Haloactinospora alba]|uniref:DHA1 family chloramphenicol resistance protein-like MFS transporter n=1 Tax=Haloactinospora alba TaxID=405555 RepID=A0A543N7H1_9ACTN|nr:MFS transporter [Haloactinospora alba]TQN27779.1 DHA1 family chloramphenicol resistance protein-like MFS transporter [Haloactinospora alba]